MTEAATNRRHFVLASQSPRRAELLRRIGIVPDEIIGADLEEIPAKGELPPAMARRLALEKLTSIKPRFPDSFVLAADTVVALGRRILGKPDDEAMARRHLALLSGRRHRVITAVACTAPDGRSGLRIATTAVSFKQLQEAEISAYIDSGEWQGKAGSYAIQGAAEMFVRRINGSYSNVVGLPLFETAALLGGLSWPILGR
ncbi:MAG: Maf family protein [Rhodospirillaceae bacterium]|nr:Maf family protein [Rhodospirillaceae bacterium]